MSLYESGRYEECATELKATLNAHYLNKNLRPEMADQAMTYLAACLIAIGKPDEADDAFAMAIRSNPQMRAPDSLIFPQLVVDRFLRVRERLLADIRTQERERIRQAERLARQRDEKKKLDARITNELRKLAAQETVVEKNRRWLASVPFGVGQFQNREFAAGWIFLGLETALLGTAVTAVTVDQRLANKYQVPGINPTELQAKRQDAYRVIMASTWGFGLVAVAGIVHAHWRFVPESRSIRTRAIPQELSLRRTEAPLIHARMLQPSYFDLSLVSAQGHTGLRLEARF